MVETKTISNNLCTVTKTKSDAVFESGDSSRQTKIQRMLHKLRSTTVKGMTKIKGHRNSPVAYPTTASHVCEQHDDILGNISHMCGARGNASSCLIVVSSLHTDFQYIDRNYYKHTKTCLLLDLLDEADLPHCPSQNLFENVIEKTQWKDLVSLIKHALSSVRDDKLGYEMLIPCGLVMCIARDIMASARKEPCGLRGCVLFINLEDKNKCQNLVKLDCDPTTVSTFELYLTLKEDTRGWCKLKKFFIFMSGYLAIDKKKTLDLKLLCSRYGLEKKKLYRLNN